MVCGKAAEHRSSRALSPLASALSTKHAAALLAESLLVCLFRSKLHPLEALWVTSAPAAPARANRTPKRPRKKQSQQRTALEELTHLAEGARSALRLSGRSCCVTGASHSCGTERVGPFKSILHKGKQSSDKSSQASLLGGR